MENQIEEGNQGGTLNTEEFIEEIRKHPAIWDLSAEEYSSRSEKIKAWEKVASRSNSQFENLPAGDKNKIVVQLQNRWKNLKTCFNREKSKQTKVASGSAANSRKEYEYYKQMSFLMNVTKSKPSQAYERNDRPGPSNTPKKKAERAAHTNETLAVEEEENKLLQTIANNLKRKQIDNIIDPDSSFLASILPHFKKVPDNCKLDLQTDILNAIKRYIPCSNYQSQYGYYSNRSYMLSSGNASSHSNDIPNSPANVSQDNVSQDSEIIEDIYFDL